ncbi:hypothetical protein H4Q26_014401 [Puccinia striiformis f. sp. tritici PST-130]|nr:hypothetical protein H4Q26_014401 [Puccinia striiformis f. sp. tritici PST-130]
MPHISDLPNEVLGLILQLAAKSYPGYLVHRLQRSRSIRQLRLVCRRWEHWLTERHWYSELYFWKGTSAMRFIVNEISRSRLPFSHVRPKCQAWWIEHSILNLYTGGAIANLERDMVTPSMLAALIALFYDTIVGLYLGFISNLSLPASTIEAIRRIKNLRTLRLGFKSYRESGESPADDGDITRHHGLDSFCSLLGAAPGLKCLDFAGIKSSDLPEILESDLDHIKLENITHLVIESSAPAHRIINKAIRLKSSLKLLSIDISPSDDCRDLLPILKTLEDKLEGLSMEHANVLDSIAHLAFSALRLLHITYLDGCLTDCSNLDMFSYAPIEILVLGGDYLGDQKANNPAFLVDTFARFPALRRLVLIKLTQGSQRRIFT